MLLHHRPLKSFPRQVGETYLFLLLTNKKHIKHMDKLRPIQERFYAIMRITFTQMLIMVALTSLTSAAHLNTDAKKY